MYLYFKALHVVFVVTWFAALFYVVRLFIYHQGAQRRADVRERELLGNHLQLMAKRLWHIIAWPSAVLTLVLGGTMLYLRPQLLDQAWMLWKLGGVALLFLYHLCCQVLLQKLSQQDYPLSPLGLRLFNELPTVLLVGIVFLAILKQRQAGWIGMGGLLALMAALYLGVRLYAKCRK